MWESLVQDLVFPLKCRKERTKPVRRSPQELRSWIEQQSGLG